MLTRYLARLGVDVDGRPPSPALLTELQLAHLIAVPFENLDVFHRREVSTDPHRAVAKIAEAGRGGWCFELNGAFGRLLAGLGFAVDQVSCRVFDGEAWGPPFDHCALVVHLEDRPWFVDVGFGDACTVPVPVAAGTYPGVPRDVRWRREEDGFVLAERGRDGVWEDQLRTSLRPTPMADFAPRSDHLRTEPGLQWTRSPFATRALDADGSRITLRPSLLRRRHGSGDFVDTPVRPAQWPALLAEHFGLVDDLTRA